MKETLRNFGLLSYSFNSSSISFNLGKLSWNTKHHCIVYWLKNFFVYFITLNRTRFGFDFGIRLSLREALLVKFETSTVLFFSTVFIVGALENINKLKEKINLISFVTLWVVGGEMEFFDRLWFWASFLSAAFESRMLENHKNFNLYITITFSAISFVIFSRLKRISKSFCSKSCF